MPTKTMEELLAEARATIARQQEQLEELVAPPWSLVTIDAIYAETLVLSNGLEIPKPKMVKDASWIGRTMRVNPLGQIVEVSPHQAFGPTGVVEYVDDGLVQVAVDQGKVTLREGSIKVAVGDTVVLNSKSTVILRKLRQESKFNLQDEVNVGWNDIGGLSEAKVALREAFEAPYLYADLFKLYGRKPSRGFLLHGRPGNGKTMLGKAVATAVAKLHKAKGASTGFLYVKGPELLSKWVGESEAQIRGLFAHAREHKRQHGYPAVVFVDEADALLPVRGDGHHSFMAQTIVPQFLSEMDGLGESAAIVLLATNRADTLDPAVVRPGRIDRKLLVPAPSKVDAAEIFEIHMCTLPMAEDRKVLIQAAVKLLYGDTHVVYRVRGSGFHTLPFTLAELASGAMIAGLVEQSVSEAIRRNITNPKSARGLTEADVEAAFALVTREQRGLNHDLELSEFVAARGMDPEKVEVVAV